MAAEAPSSSARLHKEAEETLSLGGLDEAIRGLADLLSCPRWVVGDAIGTLVSFFAGRPPLAPVALRIRAICVDYEIWRRSNPRGDLCEQDALLIQGWSAELGDALRSLLISRRWKLGGAVTKLVPRGRRSASEHSIESIVQRLNAVRREITFRASQRERRRASGKRGRKEIRNASGANLGKESKGSKGTKRVGAASVTLAEYYYRLGLAREKVRLCDQAVSAYEQAIQLNPRASRPYYRLGRLHADAGRWEEAAEAYSVAISRRQTEAVWFFRLGDALGKAGHLARAMEAYQRAVEMDPNRADFAATLAQAQEQAKKREEAADAYRAALRLDSREAAGA